MYTKQTHTYTENIRDYIWTMIHNPYNVVSIDKQGFLLKKRANDMYTWYYANYIPCNGQQCELNSM